MLNSVIQHVERCRTEIATDSMPFNKSQLVERRDKLLNVFLLNIFDNLQHRSTFAEQQVLKDVETCVIQCYSLTILGTKDIDINEALRETKLILTGSVQFSFCHKY